MKKQLTFLLLALFVFLSFEASPQSSVDSLEMSLELQNDLTPNDLRLCALLKLNMSTKEISDITGQRIGTIEMARSRIRKKIGITGTVTNLIDFLGQI